MAIKHAAKMDEVVGEKFELIDRVDELERIIAEMKLKQVDLNTEAQKQKAMRQKIESDLDKANMELERIKAQQGNITQI